MNEIPFCPEHSRETPPNGNDLTTEEPRFGAVDIVEAFTAMRHEWRGQTKESRALAEQLQQMATTLQAIAAQRPATADTESPVGAETRQLVTVIVETDHQLTRAAAAMAQGEVSRRQREASATQAIEQQLAAMSGAARWFARPLLTLLARQQAARVPADEDPALEGLNMVLARLRRLMREQSIERLDVLGQPFDAETMRAIGVVATAACPAGHVAEQYSPAYRWRGQLLRFADVRVAESSQPDA